MLYNIFWQCLNSLDLDVWKNEDYLKRKEARNVREDKKDIIPDCILTVHLYSRSKCMHLIGERAKRARHYQV